MVKSTPEKILLIDTGRYNKKERQAHAALSPGHFLEVLSTGKVQKRATANIAYQPMVALENDQEGKTLTDAYAANDVVNYIVAARGTVLQARLPAAAGAIVIGDALMLSNDGTVIKRTSTNHAIAYALEAVDNSGGGSEVFIQVEIA
jgi:hypothetical protein